MVTSTGPAPLQSGSGLPVDPVSPNHHNHQQQQEQTPFIPLSYSAEHSRESALQLIDKLRPFWEFEPDNVSFQRFTDGITNTLLKATNSPPGRSPESADGDAILLRAYGHGTDVLIDRQREAQNHELLSKFGLAPQLLARFENGMLYRFIQGAVTQPDDLRRPEIAHAIAGRLAEWHARVPCLPGSTNNSNGVTGTADGAAASENKAGGAVARVAAVKPSPNLWTVMQKWILALPTGTEEQKTRQANLQREMERLVSELGLRGGLGKNGLVFAHCDLLSGNVIILPKADGKGSNGATNNGSARANGDVSVAFIDYEYATPSPAAFDIANHFAEWGGFDCDFSVLPTRSQRREFIAEYVRTFFELQPGGGVSEQVLRDESEELFREVDLFRGVPGFYWGIWALIQATISDIDFDYASYAETRLGEYWAWREEADGTRAASKKEMPLRERRWAQE